jgi:fumarate reductase subunit C
MAQGVSDAVERAMKSYTDYHPRWMRPRVSTYWWLERAAYLKFILRELSSIFVAWFVVYLLMLVRAVSQGEPAYRQFLDWSGSPTVLLLNVVSLFFVVFHSITWFNLAPQAMVVRVGDTRVPGLLIATAHYLAWAVVTAFLIWLLVGGR